MARKVVRIRITRIPWNNHTVPERVAKAWVGLELLAVYRVDKEWDAALDMRGKPVLPRTAGGWFVKVATALRRLQRKSPQAARWYRERMRKIRSQKGGEWSLSFGFNEAEIVS